MRTVRCEREELARSASLGDERFGLAQASSNHETWASTVGCAQFGERAVRALLR